MDYPPAVLTQVYGTLNVERIICFWLSRFPEGIFDTSGLFMETHIVLTDGLIRRRSLEIHRDGKPEMEQSTFVDGVKNHVTHTRAILFGIVLFSLFLRMLWIETPVVRDEGVAGYVAMVWSRGVTPYSYPMAAVNPPLAYLIYLLPSPLFGNTVIPARMINNALFLVSIVILYLIARDWYGEKIALVSAFFYGVFMNAPIFETQLAIPSSLSIPFIVGSIYSLSVYLRNNRKTALFLSGLLMVLASLILQYQAVGMILILTMLIYFSNSSFKQHSKSWRKFVRNLITPVSILILGVAIPLLVFVIYFWSNGALANSVQSTVLRFADSNYVSQPDIYFSVKFLIIAEAVPLWLFSIVGLALCLLRRMKYDVFLIVWAIVFLIIGIPPSHFGRHYSQLIPVASVLSGVAITSILKETGLTLNLKHFRRNANHLQKKAIGILFIVTLVASALPVMYFVPVQYPNTNFSLFNENVYYTFSNSWNEQQQTVDYIVSHAGNGSVFIHGWEAELYWLSGYEAPDIRWTSSYIAPVRDITDQEYQKILNMVKTGDFGTVILMTGFRPDAIMQYVPERYFFVKNIGLYAIYSKYNAEGYSTEYSFIEKFSDALQKYSLDNGTQGDIQDLHDPIYVPVVEQLSINNQSRPAIRQQTVPLLDSQMVDSDLIYNNVTIPLGSKLGFGIAIHPDAWNKTDGVLFKVLVEDDASVHEVFSKYNNPLQNIEDRRWQDYTLSLDEYGGKTVSVYFVTNEGPSGNNACDWAYWSNPLLLESR
jgi:4-amino-4-deoxy-L-arabinose transferase-like glycosyltransferase